MAPLTKTARLRQELAMLEACEPVKAAHAEAKAAHEQARKGSDADAYARTKAELAEAARRLNETRRWLRAERRLADLPGKIEAAEKRLAALRKATPADLSDQQRQELTVLPGMIAAMVDDIPRMRAIVEPIRATLAELGAAAPAAPDPSPPPAPGDAQVDLPAVRVSARTRTPGVGA